MATEHFKKTSEQLLNDYFELRDEMKKRNSDHISLSFKEYLDFYIKYLESYPFDDEEDYEDEDEEDYGDDYDEDDDATALN